MAKVITFSRTFPQGHIRAGQPTFFVEKFWKSIYDTNYFYGMSEIESRYNEVFPVEFTSDSENIHNHAPKYHTIRAGSRWKIGDEFSPRVWSGKPYNSKQVLIGPDIEIKKVWDVVIFAEPYQTTICLPTEKHSQFQMLSLGEVAKNDGLENQDFESWFNPKKKSIEFQGQIICWSEKVDY